VNPLPKRIVVRIPNWLGDAVMATPALQRLREAAPESHITLLTAAKLADLWTNYPYANHIISVPSGESVLGVAPRLRGKFDVGLILPSSPRSALEMFLARVPIRVGFARPWRTWCLTDPIASRPNAIHPKKRSTAEIKRLVQLQTRGRTVYPASAHQIYDYLYLLSGLGLKVQVAAPKLYVTDPEIAAAKQKFLSAFPGIPCWVGMNAGAEYGPAKRWPAEQFVEAAVRIYNASKCGLVLFGGARDVQTMDSIGAGIAAHCKAPLVNLAGKTSLREFCAAVRLCRVLLTNDTGPMHLAAAVGTPVVVPFGSTSPELTGPGLPERGSPHKLLTGDVPCAPCFRRECPVDFRCMRSIAVEQVVSAVLDRLQHRTPEP